MSSVGSGVGSGGVSYALICMLADLEQVSHAHTGVVIAGRDVSVRMHRSFSGAHGGSALCGRLAQCGCLVQSADVAQISGASDHSAS